MDIDVLEDPSGSDPARSLKPLAMVSAEGAAGATGQFETRAHDSSQPSLFPSENFYVPAAVTTLRKAVTAIQSAPVRSEAGQTLNGRKLMDACILVAQLDCKLRGKDVIERIRRDRVSPIFEVRVTELARLAGIPGKNYVRLYEDLNRLFEMTLSWNIANEDQQVEWAMRAHFFSMLGVGKQSSRGLIRFSIDPSILLILLEPSNWAQLSLQVMRGLGTGPSYALYQNTWRYINTQSKSTAALPTATWVELLLGPSRYVEVNEVGEQIVVNYADFKRRVLVESIQRINEVPALTYKIELKEIRSGKRVVRLQFKFHAKEQETLGLMAWSQDIVNVLTKMGFGEKDIADLAQLHSQVVVSDALLRLRASEERLRQTGRRMFDRRRYFEGILANIAEGARIDEIDDDRLQAEIREQEVERSRQRRQEDMRLKFEDHVKRRFTQAFFALPQPEIDALTADFMRSPAGANAQILVDRRGWVAGNVGAMAQLRSWMAEQRPEVWRELLPEPQDRNLEDWLMWKAEGGEGG